ncbi:hypothetical protein ACWDUI_37765, partial [Streptosporangium sandarakinum]
IGTQRGNTSPHLLISPMVSTAPANAATTGTGLPLYALDGVVDMTAGLLRRLPGRLRSAGLVVTGGGARQERLLERLRAALRVPVGAAPEPEHATIRGLVGLCPQPVPAARTTARGR